MCFFHRKGIPGNPREKEYQAIPEKQKAGKAEYINGVIFKDFEVNVLKYTETKKKQGETVTTEFAWITDIEITEKNADKLYASYY